MITRNHDSGLLMETMLPYKDETVGFDPDRWLADKSNICLTDGNGNFTLFERSSPISCTGHYFLKARGKEALRLCKEFLKEIFTGPYDVEFITGITPHHKRGALWMNRQLGFKSSGTVNTVVGPSELVVLTKKDWENNGRNFR